jgi:toxin-antitoxin system PIN domain toxin
VSTFLADGNVLIALTIAEHIHHDAAVDWFDGTDLDLATSPITEGTLLRFLLREGRSAGEAMQLLATMRTNDWHRFWPDSIPYEVSHLVGVIGHRQVTDAYLVALALHHGGRVATLDKGLAAMHGDHVFLLPT